MRSRKWIFSEAEAVKVCVDAPGTTVAPVFVQKPATDIEETGQESERGPSLNSGLWR